MEGAQASVNTVVIAEPLRSIKEYKTEVLEALLGSRTIKITASDDAVLMAICVAQLVESTKEARKYFVDAWSTSSTSLDINQHSQQIRIFMERIQRQHPYPEDLGIVLKFSYDDDDVVVDFMDDVKYAFFILNENKRVILRGSDGGVFRAIRVAQALSDAGGAVKKSIEISTNYKDYEAAKIEIEMGPRLDPEERLGSRIGKELLKVTALNSWKRRVRRGVRPGTSYSDSKQLLTVRKMVDVRSTGESSSGSQKKCNALLSGKLKGDVGSPQLSYSNTKKQCQAPPLIDKSTGSVESPRASPFDTAKQCEAPSIDKSTGNVESPRVSSSDAEKQCKAPSIDKSKVCVKSLGASSSDTQKQSNIPRGIIL